MTSAHASNGSGSPSAFASMSYDTTSDGASNVILEVKAESAEEANAWWVWRTDYDKPWWPDTAAWAGSYKATDDTLAVFSLQDTLHTNFATSALDSIQIGFYPKNRDQSVGDLVYAGSFPFTRKTAATWAGHTIISNHAAYDSTGCDNWVSAGASFAFSTVPADTASYTPVWGKTLINLPMSVYTAPQADRLNLQIRQKDFNLPVLSFGASTNFAGAKIDSAKLWIYTNNIIPSKADSIIVWGMTNDDFQGWAGDAGEVSYSFKTKTTRWTDTDDNFDSFINLADLCACCVGSDCGPDLGVVSTEFAMADYGREIESWNSAIDVTNIVQAQADGGKYLYFLLYPINSPYTKVQWAFSNEGVAKAQYRPRLEVWASEDN